MIAMTRGPKPRGYYEAITDSKEDAEEMRAQDEVDQMMAENDAKQTASPNPWG